MGKAKKIVIYLGIIVFSLILIISVTYELLYNFPTYIADSLMLEKLVTTTISSIFSYTVSLLILAIPYYILILSFIYLFLHLRSDFEYIACNYGLVFISFLCCYIISIVVQDFSVTWLRNFNIFLLRISTLASFALYISLISISWKRWQSLEKKEIKEDNIFRIHISKNKTKFKKLSTSIIDWQTPQINKWISNSIFIFTGITIFATIDLIIEQGVFLSIRDLFLITSYLIGNILFFTIANIISQNKLYEKWFYTNDYKIFTISNDQLTRESKKEIETIIESTEKIKNSVESLSSKT